MSRRTAFALVLGALLGGALLAAPGPARAQQPAAQPPIRILARLENSGGYSVLIGADTMTAVPAAVLKAMVNARRDLETERAIVAQLRAVLAARDTIQAQVDRLAGMRRELIAMQDSQISSLKKEIDLLRRAGQGGWLSVELGAGASGGDTEPGLMAGLAIRRLRVWSLLQKSNSGAFVGVGLPIF